MNYNPKAVKSKSKKTDKKKKKVVKKKVPMRGY